MLVTTVGAFGSMYLSWGHPESVRDRLLPSESSTGSHQTTRCNATFNPSPPVQGFAPVKFSVIAPDF
ncbi:hypothetical protein [Laspinema palackyanum]|uniref:hypothetical protein n=1 Tax=Laspinema palackyanum TaxID=3231601 RepID=UPI00345C878D|nr:hypothetical protein [Laspinema sp. D2c]